ncbi:hypothetical protein, partial [Aquabacterium sp.]|uniref:hypothetical protein n=1 Tax=Aquabacterium sp. TaxID=1872578 RepID=UPI003784F176
FSGQYAGTEQGVFSVIIGTDGRISGIGQSSSGASFNVSGVASANGTLVMSGNGTAGTSQFTGVIDPNSGNVVGTWRQANGRAQGTFNGRKQ